MTRCSVAVLDDYQEVAADFGAWHEVDGDITFFTEHLAHPDVLVEQLMPFDVIVAMRERTPFPRELIASLPNLRLLVTTGMRNASIDLSAAREHEVTVCGTDSPGHATAELTFALIQALARGLVGEIDSVRSGGWQRGLGRDLRGAQLGVIGLGRLGTQVATMGKVFGMDVSAWSHNLTPERTEEVGVRLARFDELLASADFVSIHVRLSDRTRGLIGTEQLALMRPDAYLVNTSRGPIVDTSALIAAVQNGAIAGAALDVHETEPLPPDHAVRSEPRILVTPHIGYVTRQTYEIFYGQAVEDIVAWRSGAPIRVMV